MEEGEPGSVLCVRPEVRVYRIPPRLDQPSRSGRLRITAKGQVAYIKLEDRTSGELFAQALLAQVDQLPGTAVESVADSCRYFVPRIEDGKGRRAFIGTGCGDRGDASDSNAALQDHSKWVEQQCEFAEQAQNPDQGPHMKKKEGAAGTPRARPASAGGLSLLPPPRGRLPVRLNQAQAGSSSDLSVPFSFLITISGKEPPHLGQRKEDEALPGQLLFGA
ncbi:unnamed protein product [Nyctereutes procyonoides]|uniref:(raccoon dog) hypothetical protein n=1 Tax=Nyctereutes procyonoides TaxID=34880 RepID=A0A811YEQ6_NYCPR|nr:unnamed protein product [Nyctereutes procyonoides]